MIVAVAFCPHPPVLVPEVAQGAAPELAGLRAACVDAVTRICSPGRQIAVLGAGPSSRWYPADSVGTFAGFGVDRTVTLGAPGSGPADLPLSLTVGAWLLDRADYGPAVGLSVGPEPVDAARVRDGEWALLVMGDGSARRSTAAPGYLDDRAGEFDAGVVAALAGGCGAALAGLDPVLGDELLAAGVPAWRAAGAMVGDRSFAADVRYDDAPFGVGYFVATWT